MGIISKEVEVILDPNTTKHYESLGYEIPRVEKIRRDKYGRNKGRRIVVKRGTKITVKIKDLPLKSKYYIFVKCDYCGKEYPMEYSNYNRSNKDGKIYCKKCTSVLFRSRENNHNWNPNKTDEDRELGRHYKEYTYFIKRVLARDKYTCQCCGENNVRLDVHHLNGYNWYVEGRLDETNAITLCKNCHDNFHSIYGNGNNTKEQFENWIDKTLDGLRSYDGDLPTARKIYCIEDAKTYDSVSDVSKLYGGSVGNIYKCCRTYTGFLTNKPYKFPAGHVKKRHYLWYDDYLNSTEQDIENYLKWANNFSGKKKSTTATAVSA